MTNYINFCRITIVLINSKNLIKTITFSFLGLVFLAHTAPAQAAKLDIPTPLKYDGLTFLPPLPAGIILESHAPVFEKYSTIIDFQPLKEDAITPEPSLTPDPTETITITP